MDWFISELEDLVQGVPHSGDPRLLCVAHGLQVGALPEIEIAKYKAASIHYANTRLIRARGDEQDAFLQFLVHSELANDSIELRRALAALLRGQIGKPFDRLSQGLAVILLRAKNDVIGNMMGDLLSQVRETYRAAPSWGPLSVLGAMVGRVSGDDYSIDSLIDDLLLLADKPDFEANLRLRNAIWRDMRPSSNSIDLLTRVRSRQGQHSAMYPQVISSAVNAVSRSVYHIPHQAN